MGFRWDSSHSSVFFRMTHRENNNSLIGFVPWTRLTILEGSSFFLPDSFSVVPRKKPWNPRENRTNHLRAPLSHAPHVRGFILTNYRTIRPMENIILSPLKPHRVNRFYLSVWILFCRCVRERLSLITPFSPHSNTFWFSRVIRFFGFCGGSDLWFSLHLIRYLRNFFRGE